MLLERATRDIRSRITSRGTSCWTAVALTLMVFTEPAFAVPITKILSVNAFTFCDDSGLNCASKGPAGNLFFERETDKIWAQAGIDVAFVERPNINNSFPPLLPSPSSTTVDMFLVHTIPGAYGIAWVGSGGIAIAMDTVMAFNPGVGRLDTIAHELGHNLGLVPTSLGGVGFHEIANPNYLMAAGGSFRNVPSSLEQICPDGPCYDFLPQAQIDVARESELLRPVPEPGTILLFGTTAAALGLVRRGHRVRRRRSAAQRARTHFYH